MYHDRISQMRRTLLAIVAASGLMALVLSPAMAGFWTSVATTSAVGLNGPLGSPDADVDEDEEETPGPISAGEVAELTDELQAACGPDVEIPELTGLTEDAAEALIEPLIDACESTSELIAELQAACGPDVQVPDLTGLTEDAAEALVEPLIEACDAAAEPTEPSDDDEDDDDEDDEDESEDDDEDDDEGDDEGDDDEGDDED